MMKIYDKLKLYTNVVLALLVYFLLTLLLFPRSSQCFSSRRYFL